MKNIYLGKNIIGADETGVGDYLSPLVSAAVFISPKNIKFLDHLDIKDSKKLSDKKILEIFEKIKPYIKSSVRKMSQKQYNYLTSKGFNANELKMILHMQAISAVEERVENIDLVILDAFSNESSLNKYRMIIDKKTEYKNWKTKTKYVEKGESEHIAVAAASIVARSYFIKMMESQNQKWNTVFPLGTNDRVEAFTLDFIKNHGKDSLYEVSKISFKTTKKILEDF